MESPPDYSTYTRAQLQDALRHIKREKYPDNFVALTSEIERRRNTPPISQPASYLHPRHVVPPIARPDGDSFQNRPPVAMVNSDSSQNGGCLVRFLGWIGGNIVGAFVGGVIFYINYPPNVPDYDDGLGWGFGMVVISTLGALIGGCVGFGVSPSIAKRLKIEAE